MPIYTRTGDKGQTSLFDGTRVPKHHARVETYAAIDELNSVIGQAISLLPKTKFKVLSHELEAIQHDLFAIGAALALPHALPVAGLEDRPKMFEKRIDEMTAILPPLKEFILPGGGKAGSSLHVARTLARRAERRVTALAEHEDMDQSIVVYINRLSDLLFTIARFVNHQENHKETKWIKR